MERWHKIIKAFWVVYLIFIVLISLWSFSQFLKIFPLLTLVDWLHLITLPLWAIILIAYIWKKDLVSVRWWQAIFYFTIADTVLSVLAFFKEFSVFSFMNIIYGSNLPNSTSKMFYHQGGNIGIVINIFLVYFLFQFMLLVLPGFYANYKLAFPKGLKRG